jgi:hypothetical protein
LSERKLYTTMRLESLLDGRGSTGSAGSVVVVVVSIGSAVAAHPRASVADYGDKNSVSYGNECARRIEMVY